MGVILFIVVLAEEFEGSCSGAKRSPPGQVILMNSDRSICRGFEPRMPLILNRPFQYHSVWNKAFDQIFEDLSILFMLEINGAVKG
jgi:hypothetical protein